eukprot:gb/GECH01000830.1/.p1 GENE.gb/GECH01000830.1/~~gb/GECH01000830.1/.p1  ORF type:complete len:179 (+),score=46.22 gb/GECH01000830.1/:1-537(+)
MSKRGENQKRIKSNNEMIKKHLIITIIVLAIYLLYRVLYHWDSFKNWQWFGFMGVLLPGYFGAFSMIQKAAAPTTSDRGEIIDVEDLNRVEGLTEYMFDILYISWFVQITTMFSEWFWVIYLVIPAFLLFKAWTGILGPLLSGFGGGGGGNDQEQTISKRQQKLQARREKGQPIYKRH